MRPIQNYFLPSYLNLCVTSNVDYPASCDAFGLKNIINSIQNHNLIACQPRD